MQKLDEATVQAVQLTAPGAFPSEAQSLIGHINSGQIFGAFTQLEREVIWTRLCSASTNFLIPSLYSFFENLKYLKGPADCMRRLIHLENKETIHSALESAHSEMEMLTDGCLIQVSETTFKRAPNVADQFDIAYRQQWLYAFREYQDMPAETKKKLARPTERQANEAVLFEFASLAHRQGYRSKEIQSILQQDPDREIARRLLLEARNKSRYIYKDLEISITQVVDAMDTAELIEEGESVEDPELDEHPRPPNRCGVVNDVDQPRDKSSMFLPNLHSPYERRGRDLTSFFVQRSIYFAFFGNQICIDVASLGEEAGFEFSTQTQRQQRHNQLLQG